MIDINSRILQGKVMRKIRFPDMRSVVIDIGNDYEMAFELYDTGEMYAIRYDRIRDQDRMCSTKGFSAEVLSFVLSQINSIEMD